MYSKYVIQKDTFTKTDLSYDNIRNAVKPINIYYVCNFFYGTLSAAERILQ